MIIIRHHFGPEEITLVQFIDQDIEFLQMSVDLRWVDLFTAMRELRQFFGDVIKSFSKQLCDQVELKSRNNFGNQDQGAVDHSFDEVDLKGLMWKLVTVLWFTNVVRVSNPANYLSFWS